MFSAKVTVTSVLTAMNCAELEGVVAATVGGGSVSKVNWKFAPI